MPRWPVPREVRMTHRPARYTALRSEIYSWSRAVGFALLALAAIGAAISIGAPALELLAFN